MSSKRKSKAQSTDAPAIETTPEATTEAQAVAVLEQGAEQVIGPAPDLTNKPAEVSAAPAPTVSEAPAQPTAKAEAKKPKEPKPLAGMMYELKRLVYDDHALSVDDLMSRLKARGYAPSKTSVQTIRADYLHTIRVLHFVGVKGLSKFISKT